MEMSVGSRLKHAWNAFLGNEFFKYSHSLGPSYSYRPDRPIFSRGNERSIITSVYNRIALDAASIAIQHARLDDDGRFTEVIDSSLNSCLTLEANLDQTGRAFIQDVVMSMLDEGCVAIVPTDTDLDPETGKVTLVEYDAVVDCGTTLNPNLARVQTEGGLAQGIGMAMYEDIHYSEKGQVYENSLMQYKIPSRLDVGTIRVEFENSYEPNGPFGAKSIGEVVINTPSPAIANAVYNAVGVRVRELPVTAEKVFMGMQGL